MFEKAKIQIPLQVVTTVEDAICYLKGEGVYADRKKFPFPVMIFLDLHLSGRSGFKVLDWLKEHSRARPAGEVVLTGSDTGEVRKSYQRGADSFLVKPLQFEDFQI